uniref:S1 motif domain-containing protein n=1 Tax=Physcomitrium patens TaxID=3218 RepID=A0A7I4BCJ1_PHYPA
MSGRVCIQQRQGLVFCPRGGITPSRALQAPGALLFHQPSKRFSRRGLTVSRPKFRLHKARTSKWFAEYTDSRDSSQDVRSGGVDLDLVHGDGAASNSAYPKSREIRDGEHTSVNRIFVDSSASRLNGHANGHVLEESYSFGEHHFSKIIEGDVITKSDSRGKRKMQKQNLSEEVDETLSRASDSQVSLTDVEYYVPICGHRVTGVVVSGNYAKLDMDIGAAKLGQMHVQEILPLDKFQIDQTSWILADDAGEGGGAGLPPNGHTHVLYDEEVFTYEAPESPLLVDIGTVLDMEVVGITTSGRALLSARKAAQRIEWNRIMQIKRRLQVGSLHDGIVAQLYPYGALVKVNETGTIWGMIHISNISNARIDKISNVFEIGEQIKMIVVNCPIPDKFSFSTALLESEPGLMLRDKQRVFREAEERAITLQNEHPKWKQPPDDIAENSSTGTTSKPIANLKWLEFVKEETPLSQL